MVKTYTIRIPSSSVDRTDFNGLSGASLELYDDDDEADEGLIRRTGTRARTKKKNRAEKN